MQQIKDRAENQKVLASIRFAQLDQKKQSNIISFERVRASVEAKISTVLTGKGTITEKVLATEGLVSQINVISERLNKEYGVDVYSPMENFTEEAKTLFTIPVPFTGKLGRTQPQPRKLDLP